MRSFVTMVTVFDPFYVENLWIHTTYFSHIWEVFVRNNIIYCNKNFDWRNIEADIFLIKQNQNGITDIVVYMK